MSEVNKEVEMDYAIENNQVVKQLNQQFELFQTYYPY